MKPSQSIIEEKKSKTRFQVEYFATTGFEVVAPQETDDVKQLKIKMEAHMILGAPSEAPSGTFESRDPVHAPQQPPTMPVPPPRPSFSISELRTSTEAATRECEQLRKLVETIQQERDNLVSSKEALALDRDHYKNALEITVESLKSAQNQLKQLEKQQALQQQQHQQLKQEQIQLQLQQLTASPASPRNARPSSLSTSTNISTSTSTTNTSTTATSTGNTAVMYSSVSGPVLPVFFVQIAVVLLVAMVAYTVAVLQHALLR